MILVTISYSNVGNKDDLSFYNFEINLVEFGLKPRKNNQKKAD